LQTNTIKILSIRPFTRRIQIQRAANGDALVKSILKERGMRFRIQVVAPNPQTASELQWAMEALLKQEGEIPPDDADKILTTGWLATAEEALLMFKEICS
jgi:hypothetical protein